MTRDELIAELQSIPDNREVLVCDIQNGVVTEISSISSRETKDYDFEYGDLDGTNIKLYQKVIFINM